MHPIANGAVCRCASAPSWNRKRMEPSLQPMMKWEDAEATHMTAQPNSWGVAARDLREYV
jgi:hypothetical protein